MAINGTLGSKLFISDAAIAATVDTEQEFAAQSWTEVGLIESFGEFGRQFDLATFQAVKDGRTYKLKAGYNDGNIQFTLGQDLSDAGQLALKTAAELTTQANYGFRIEFNDAPSTVGGPTTVYFRGLAMSFRSQMGAANAVIRATSSVEVNSDILMADPAELYDRFTSGSLTHYELFNGTDAQAADPVISSSNLVLVTGDDGGGFAADGSQAIGDTGYDVSAGAVVFEARVKTSAITDVSIFVGLTDQKASLEIPVESAGSANTITTNATDAVGFMFDTDMTDDNIWLVGVDTGSDATPQDSALAFVADTYRTLRVEVATTGEATFYIDGTAIGTAMTNATAATTLYPTIAAGARSTASRTVTVDYLYVRQA